MWVSEGGALRLEDPVGAGVPAVGHSWGDGACGRGHASVCLRPPAPELLEQKPYGKAVDVWALGVISYIL